MNETKLSNDFLFYLLALMSVDNIGVVKTKQILNRIEHPKYIFEMSHSDIQHECKISLKDAEQIKKFKQFTLIEDELNFITTHQIKTSFYKDAEFNYNLKNIDDAPVLLFYLGNADTHKQKIISIVGTRQNSHYGKKIVEDIVSALSHLNVIIVSGLAEGIDTVAHQCALNHTKKTFGILGHGLKTIYPTKNRDLVKKMLAQDGAILTEFFSYVTPSKETFPIRNRIVAGMCDALIVVETKKNGGSIITANIANEYNKEVFAIPGKIGDEKSEGCNYLIQSHKATIINNPKDIITLMNWENNKKTNVQVKELPLDLNDNKKIIINFLSSQNEKTHLDDLINNTKLAHSILSEEILLLELLGIIKCLPGKYYVLE